MSNRTGALLAVFAVFVGLLAPFGVVTWMFHGETDPAFRPLPHVGAVVLGYALCLVVATVGLWRCRLLPDISLWAATALPLVVAGLTVLLVQALDDTRTALVFGCLAGCALITAWLATGRRVQ